MTGTDIERDQPINLDASTSQELKRIVVAKQADEDPSASHVIPDVPRPAARSNSDCRELLNQPFEVLK